MKADDSHPPVSPFNTPEVMRARSLFVIQFIALIGCLACAEAALAEQAWRLMVPSGMCLAVMTSIRMMLKRNGQWDVCVNGLNHAYSHGEPVPNHEESSMRLMDLIDRRDGIESRRGHPDFDPWALQDVRHEINQLVKEHPPLAELLEDDR